MKIIAPLLAALLAWSATAAYAQWVWVDKDGRKVFSDRAPGADVPEKDILKRPVFRAPPAATPASAPSATASAAASPASAAQPVSAEKELEAKKKQAQEAEQARQRAEEARVTAARVENCGRAKQALSTVNSGVPMTQMGKNGPEVMSDAARAAESRRIQAVIDVDCR